MIVGPDMDEYSLSSSDLAGVSLAIIVDFFAYGKAMGITQILGGIMILLAGYSVSQGLPIIPRLKQASLPAQNIED